MSESEVLDIEIPKNVKWQVLTLNDIKSPEKRSIISGPFGSNISSKYFTDSGVPVIRGNNLSNTLGVKFKDGGFVFISPEKARELNSWAIKDDLLFTAAGTIGQVGMLTGKEFYDKYTISNKQLRVRLDKNIINPYFAYYWFASPAIVDLILQRDTGSTIPLINLGVLRSLPIILPPLDEQEAIAEVLSSLDDKIDLLLRNNKTLEELAETLFRNKFSESVDYQKLSYFGRIICGKTPSKSNSLFFGGQIPFLKIPDMHSRTFVFETIDSLTEEGKKSQLNKTIPAYSISVSCIATVGLVTINAMECQTNQQINTIVPKESIYTYYLFNYLRSITDDLIQRASSGSVTHNLNTSDFSNIDIPIYSNADFALFHSEVEPLYEKVYINSMQIRKLENMRNTLLPKLMSGTVRVNH